MRVPVLNAPHIPVKDLFILSYCVLGAIFNNHIRLLLLHNDVRLTPPRDIHRLVTNQVNNSYIVAT